ncbi:ceramide kinase isoform X2 [Phymastichus coffea]|uniref:ceramide kinase isoform X2 n=1 Tax=Phymastichus coffea TaxID=108790 RepID=UPI00273BD58F|nr:ceramide kinase isoform X2 [Phymastichus coffea]
MGTANEDEDPMRGTVLLTTFVIRRKRCRVYFHRGTLVWETERPPYTRWKLALTDVISATYGPGGGGGGGSSFEDEAPTSFALNYAARAAKNKWRKHTVTMSHDDPRQIASWVKTINNYLAALPQRPRKILLFVNPYGGKRKGLRIWEKRVAPLMQLAGVEAKVVVTERAGHIRDTLLSCELDNYQAAVCVGGDGTFSELFNGLIWRAARDLRLDLNDPGAPLPQPSLPVGMIPGGSTDTLAYSLHGTCDAETAALHIIFGDTAGLDLSTVHGDGTGLLRIYASILSYGYLGDVVRDSEKFRWMGPQRYDYSGFKKIIANKGYEGEVMLLSDTDEPASGSRCTRDCPRCSERSGPGGPEDRLSRWLTVRGKFFMVNGANVSCACAKSPMGFSPHCHIGDGCVDVILVRHTSLINNIRMLLRLGSKDKTLYDLPFVEVYRAREFTFRASEPKRRQQDQPEPDAKAKPNRGFKSQLSSSALSVWNCDGEVIDAASVKIRVHCQLLKVLTRRMQPAPESRRRSSWFCLL